MNTPRRLFSFGLFLLFACTLVACAADEKVDNQTTSQPSTYGRTVRKAREVAAAVSNPEPGLDPVCGMAIDETAIIVTIADKNYGVCSEDCAEKLRADPEKYVHAAAGR